MRNIILIGYQGVGKTFYGKRLSRHFSMNFIDTDALLEEKFKTSIKNLYKTLGEKDFRNREKESILQLKEVKNSVIATGGGVVEIEDITFFLQGLGLVVYIHCELHLLKSRWKQEGLFYNGVDIEEKFNQRARLYEICCHKKVEGKWDQILSVGNLR